MPDDTPAKSPPSFMPRDEMIEEANRLIAEAGPDFMLWLASEKLEAADGERPAYWSKLTAALSAQGKLDGAETWIKAQKIELVERWKVTRRPRVAGEICRRFLAAKMKGVAPTPKVALASPYSPETDILPEYHRWVMRHPGLVPVEEGEDDTVIKSTVLLYERTYPAPGQEALNLLRHCQRYDPARQKMFDDVKAYLVEARKKKELAGGEGNGPAAKSEEAESIEELKRQLGGWAASDVAED